jgi:large subunit ribosomal protein L25
MANEIPTLKATNREQLGSRYAKRLRTAGKLPAVLYGHGTAPMSLTLDAKILFKTVSVVLRRDGIGAGARATVFAQEFMGSPAAG